MDETKLNENDLEHNDNEDATFTEDQETTTEAKLQAEQDESEPVTLSRSELEERLREARREQDKRWKDRIKSLKGDEDSKENSPKVIDSGVVSKEELDRFRLEAKGVEDKASQDFILRYAKLEGMSVSEAMKDELVQAKLNKLSADVERMRATQSPTNRTGRPREKTPEELARQVEKGQLPTTKEERKIALKALQSKFGRTS